MMTPLAVAKAYAATQGQAAPVAPSAGGGQGPKPGF